MHATSATPRTPDTRQRLLDAGARLFAEHGYKGVSVRELSAAATANVAAVSYHFGSKDALIAEVYGDALREVSEVQRARLAVVPADAPLEDLVRVWLAPALGERGRDPRETRLWALVQRGVTERAPGLIQSMGAIRDLVDTHLIERLAAALPHLGHEELMLRHNAVLAAVGAMATADAPGLSMGPPSDRTTDMLVTWIVGGLRAPATERALRP